MATNRRPHNMPCCCSDIQNISPLIPPTLRLHNSPVLQGQCCDHANQPLSTKLETNHHMNTAALQNKPQTTHPDPKCPQHCYPEMQVGTAASLSNVPDQCRHANCLLATSGTRIRHHAAVPGHDILQLHWLLRKPPAAPYHTTGRVGCWTSSTLTSLPPLLHHFVWLQAVNALLSQLTAPSCVMPLHAAPALL
jgi:hypothetical protein